MKTLLESLNKYQWLQALMLVFLVAPPVRNPFIPPVPPASPSQIVGGSQAPGTPSSSAMQRPELRGIIWSAEKPSAFLLWQGRTDRYLQGASIGSYRLVQITPKKVVLQQGQALISLEL